MIDPSFVGMTFPPFSYEVDRAKIRELAAATGDQNPLYRDLAAAQAAGFPDLPAPPTLPTLFGFWPSTSLLDHLRTIGVELRRVLHGEEEYEYHRPVFPGDIMTGAMTITNIRSRKTMDLVTLETTYTNQRGELAVVAKTLMIVRNDI
jgi:acyl dehydratase